MNNFTKSDSGLGLVVFICLGTCLLGILTGTGIGAAFQVYKYAKYLTVLGFVVCVAITSRNSKHLSIGGFAIIYLIFINIFYKLIYHVDMFDYLWLYLLVYIISMLRLTKKQMQSISLIYGAVGFVVLYASAYTEILDGWDGNMISMMAFYCYLMFAVSYIDVRKKSLIALFILYSAVYVYFVYPLECRSVLLASLFFVLCVFSIIRLKRFFTRKRIVIVLLVPLFIAIVVVLIRDASFVGELNTWSLLNSGKPIFNGREQIWYRCFLKILQHPIFGAGNLSYSNTHNSALFALGGGGLIGYIIWIKYMRNAILEGTLYIEDNVVYGLLMAIIVVWVQQSVDMGIIGNTNVNCSFYCMLGLLLARARTVAEECEFAQMVGGV